MTTTNQTNAELKVLKSATKKAFKKAKAKSAKLRRKLNEHWEYVGETTKYKRFAAKSARKAVTSQLKDELIDGIFLVLNDRNCGKTSKVQMRILRRIVDKRQGQAAHRTVGRTEDKLAAYLGLEGTCRCMEALHRHQMRC